MTKNKIKEKRRIIKTTDKIWKTGKNIKKYIKSEEYSRNTEEFCIVILTSCAIISPEATKEGKKEKT